jgi:hypothetical protein
MDPNQFAKASLSSHYGLVIMQCKVVESMFKIAGKVFSGLCLEWLIAELN